MQLEQILSFIELHFSFSAEKSSYVCEQKMQT